MLYQYILNHYADSDYVTNRRAKTLYYFNLILLISMPIFLTVYIIWIPQRLHVAAPPMVATWIVALAGLLLLRRGNLFATGHLLAVSLAAVIIVAQARKIEGEFATAYSSFIHLFPLPVLIIGLFGRKRYIIPIAIGMGTLNVIFFMLIRTKISGEIFTAAQVGMMASLIALILVTSLLYLLRNIMDKALIKVEITNVSIRRFVPVEFLRLLKKENLEDIGVGECTEREMTILFSDIRNFTAISEKLSPAQNFAFLNAYLSTMGPVIRQHGGFIDKYIGDAIMALFESPESALRAAQAMVIKLGDFNARIGEYQVQALQIGIGVHTGKIMLGTIGESMRLENTVISDAVNTASRIEHLNKKFQTQILVSKDTLDLLTEKPIHRLIDLTLLRGKRKIMEIDQVLPADTNVSTDPRMLHQGEFNHALQALRAGEFTDAKIAFERYLESAPEDYAAKRHLQTALQHLGLDHDDVTLYVKYGRQQKIDQIVEGFYKKVVSEPSISDFFEGIDLGRLRKHQARFIAVVMGAKIPYDYNLLQTAHANLAITMEHFQVVANLLQTTLSEHGVASTDVQTIMERIGKFARIIITRGTVAAASQ
jgi:class 3 adenylate cyclase/truncated hemoglobin YjbI